jgi:hypothetical protein
MSRAAADAWITPRRGTLIGAIHARRAAIQIRFPQVLRTHSDAAIPANGGAVAPDRLSARTPDNGDGWADLGITFPGAWNCALEINNYGGSRGHGFEIVFYVREGGKLYRRVDHIGPETHRERGWTEVPSS